MNKHSSVRDVTGRTNAGGGGMDTRVRYLCNCVRLRHVGDVWRRGMPVKCAACAAKAKA